MEQQRNIFSSCVLCFSIVHWIYGLLLFFICRLLEGGSGMKEMEKSSLFFFSYNTQATQTKQINIWNVRATYLRCKKGTKKTRSPGNNDEDDGGNDNDNAI